MHSMGGGWGGKGKTGDGDQGVHLSHQEPQDVWGCSITILYI